MKTIILIAVYLLSFNANIIFAQAKEYLVNNDSYSLSIEKRDSLISDGYCAFGGQWGGSIQFKIFYCVLNIPDSSIVTLKLHDPYFDTTYVIYTCVLSPSNYKYIFGLRPDSQLIRKDGFYDFILEAQNFGWEVGRSLDLGKISTVEFKCRMRCVLIR